MNIEKVAFIINQDDCWEGIRSTLGLLVENMWCAAFVIDHEMKVSAPKTDEDLQENLEMLVEDLEGEVYSNVQAMWINFSMSSTCLWKTWPRSLKNTNLWFHSREAVHEAAYDL